MKRQIKETTIIGNRGPQRVITYGYDTKVDGLDVIRTIDDERGRFSAVHMKSGLGIGVYFTSATKAIRFVNKYLTGFDFMQDKDDLLKDGKLSRCVYEATVKEEI